MEFAIRGPTWTYGLAKRTLKEICQAYSVLLFSHDIRVGLVLLCLSFVNLSSGAHALAVYAAVRLFTRMLGQSRQDLNNPFLMYNPLLVGLSVGYLFAISPLSLFLAVSAGIFCQVLSQALQNAMGLYFSLPILNLPFSLVATLIYLAGVKYGSLFVAQPVLPEYLNFDQIPLWLSGLFHALGILVFLPSDVAGICLLVMFWFISRIQFFLIVLSYYAGTLFHGLLYGNFPQAFQDPFNFNFISVGLALGGYFLIASKKSYVLVVLAVGVAALVQDALGVFWSGIDVPVFTFPFVVATLLFLYVLKVHHYSHITQIFSKTPEDNLEYWIFNTNRFGSTLPAPFLPFAGEWTVYQGFDDKWTHQGLWKHAVDFVITDPETGKSCRGEGKALQDYYCYAKPVLAPVAGRVVAVESEYPDNAIGEVDSENNWGNHIVIQTDFGYYVEISHLKQKSALVEVGQAVNVGHLLGYCGNSGYSPQPHLHIQCQQQAFAGAPTLPFTFSSAVAGKKLLGPNHRLERDDRIHPLSHSTHWVSRLNYVLDEDFAYACTLNGQPKVPLRFKVAMDAWGTQVLEDMNSNARLYFTHVNGRFTFLRYEGNSDSWLRFFFIAIPSFLPTDEEIAWDDVLPGNILKSRPGFYSFLQSLEHSWFSSQGTWTLNALGEVKGRIVFKSLWPVQEVLSKCQFQGHRGPDRIEVQNKGKHYVLQIIKV